MSNGRHTFAANLGHLRSNNFVLLSANMQLASEKPAVAMTVPVGKRAAHITVIAQITIGCMRARDLRI